MKQRFSAEQLVQLRREGEAAETKADVWRQYGVSAWISYRWRQRYGGLAEAHAKRSWIRSRPPEAPHRRAGVGTGGPEGTTGRQGAVVTERRELVLVLITQGVSECLAWHTVGLGRASYRYRGRLRTRRRACLGVGTLSKRRASSWLTFTYRNPSPVTSASKVRLSLGARTTRINPPPLCCVS